MSRLLRDSAGKAVSGIALSANETALFDDYKKDTKQYLSVYKLFEKRAVASIGWRIVQPAENKNDVNSHSTST